MTEIPERVLEKIEEAKEEKLSRLDLSANGLTELPDSIAQLQNLTVLDLSYNRLTKIPDSITQLRNLTEFNLGGNKLTTLPDSIAQMQNLIGLDLGGNKLTEMPASIVQLSKLTELYLNRNQLTEVPDSITRLQNLTMLDLCHNKLAKLPDSITRLQNLTELYLGGNKLTEIPDFVSRLQNLTVLNLYGNRLTGIPDSIAQMQNLTELYLSGNKLTEMPASITRLQNLTELYLYGNRLTELPESIAQLRNLAGLDLRRNQLTELPDSITQLQNLTALYLSGNPMGTPPLEVALKGIEAIRDYFRQVEAEGEDHLYEAKLLIVGEAGAGKTTLAKKIDDPDYQLRDEETTRGIDVVRWSFPMENGQTFWVNIWDFGGQEIYHATHQFFLTKRSLYALVADVRKEDTDFYYWLNVVELLSDNSPLLIVKNEKQDRHREINERQLRGQFGNLKETLAANLATNRGFPEILDAIKYHVSKLPHIGSALPRTWVRVREALEEDPRNYMSLDEYLEICGQNGFTRQKDKLQLSGYLHDLGVCLHFQEDPLLRKTVILKPEWGTAAVYKVLDNETVISKHGEFNRADLAAIWDEPEYANMRDELLQLMLNFKLCYKIPESTDTYIAPQLLTENQPEYSWDEADNLLLRYTYEFMPKGIVTRFIVAMHQFIADQRCVWRSGVILEKDQTRAEVIEHYGRREIRIRVAGKHKREVMTIVVHELDKIHATYNRLKYSKLIPCNCAECEGSQEPYFYKFEILRSFMERRQEQIQCQKTGDMVGVRGLVDDMRDRAQFFERESGEGRGVVFKGPVERVSIQMTGKGDKVVEKKGEEKDRPVIRSAWANGSFFLFTFLVVITALGVLARTVPIYALPIILIAGGIFVPIIGAFQLKQDDQLSEKSFMELMKMAIGQLPLIGKLARRSKSEE
jgi:internalin A